MKYNKSYLARRLALSLIIGGMFVSSAYALPQGGAVVGGGSNGNIGGSGHMYRTYHSQYGDRRDQTDRGYSDIQI